MASIALAIPCFNEAQRLRPSEFLEFTIPGHRLEFVFVNDGSTDATPTILRQLMQGRSDTCRLVDLTPNQGKAEAVRQGMLNALDRRPDYVGFWDADLATPLAEVPLFLHALEEDNRRQMIFGARVKLMGRNIERLAVRHYLGRVFATAVSMTLGLAIYDTQCGAKLFRATKLLAEALSEPFRAKWIFDVELLARFIHLSGESGRKTLSEALYEMPLRQWCDVKGSKLRSTDFITAVRDLWLIRRAYFG
jgi:glycosyltransferase involved in cell wall biosynthesis